MWAATPACNGLLIHRRRILFILLALRSKSEILSIPYTAQKMKFLIKDFFSKCDTTHCTKKMKFSIMISSVSVKNWDIFHHPFHFIMFHFQKSLT